MIPFYSFINQFYLHVLSKQAVRLFSQYSHEVHTSKENTIINPNSYQQPLKLTLIIHLDVAQSFCPNPKPQVKCRFSRPIYQ